MSGRNVGCAAGNIRWTVGSAPVSAGDGCILPERIGRQRLGSGNNMSEGRETIGQGDTRPVLRDERGNKGHTEADKEPG